MREIDFVKAVASGNDFIIIDKIRNQPALALVTGRPGKPETSPSTTLRTGSERSRTTRNQIIKLAKELCQRKLSIGADGLLVIEPSKKADLKMRIFNPDGSEVDMCGNGARCVALYASKEKICGNKMAIETRAGNLQAEVEKDKVKIKMTEPQGLRLNFDLNVNGRTYNVNFINTGVPHVVCFVEDLDNFDVPRIGHSIRYHPQFQPQGTNADFVKVLSKTHIRLRTYERGVEEETLACGTGAVAASIISALQMNKSAQGGYKVKVDTQSRESLYVYFNIKESDLIDEVFLEGKAKIIYCGRILF